MKIKKNDTVKVLSGRNKGHRGKVLSVNRDANEVTVEGVNEVYRHVKRSQRNMQGGRLSKCMPVPVAKVMLVCPTCQKATRVKMGVNAYGKKTRVCKKCGIAIE